MREQNGDDIKMVRPSHPKHSFAATDLDLACRQYLDRIRTTAGPFAMDEIDGTAVIEAMDSMKIL